MRGRGVEGGEKERYKNERERERGR